MLTIEEIANGQDVAASYQAFAFGPVAAAALIAVVFATQQSLIYWKHSYCYIYRRKWKTIWRLEKCSYTYDVEFWDDLTSGGGDCICCILIEPRFNVLDG